MKILYKYHPGCLIVLIWSFLSGCSPGENISYNRDIRPIFNRNCLGCHGGIKQSGGFSLLFEEEAFAATESGHPAIVRGRPGRSELMRRLRHQDPNLRMPLEKPPLTDREIQLIENWIRQGARWEKHWAYIPPDITISPPPVNTGWVMNGIDAFIFASLASNSLSPNQEADRSTLLRRLSLDLTGLPPSLAETDAFLADKSPNAYEKQVDRLLASPHFGERWASMWLDLARYADSKGYEKDLYRSIWKYRDWVINAFNRDMPFDQFTVEQLAGDLLPGPTEDQLIATAFHRNTMANDEGGTDNEEFRNYANIERVGTTFEVWQGTTMSCVQCHSHPYDPFRHEDFYQLLAFFNNTADRDIYHEGPNLFTYESPDRENVESIIHWLENELKPADHIRTRGQLHQRKQHLLEHLGYRHVEAEHFDESSAFIELAAPEQNTLFQIQDTSWIRFEELDLTDIKSISFRYTTPFGGFIEARLGHQTGKLIGKLQLPPTARPSDRNRWKKWRVLEMPISPVAGKKDVFFYFRKDQHQDSDLFRIDWFHLNENQPAWHQYDEEFRKRVQDLSSISPTPTPIMQELPPRKRRKTYVFERGNWLVAGPAVTTGIPAALGQLPADQAPDRLAMARWLVDPRQPLTARVAVNRFWEQLFGFGIVETVEDLGTQGSEPSHPELLDWLAVRFANDWQWSIKRLLREMVLSSTYRQSGQVTEEKLRIDPRNRLLSRGPRLRLSAEQVRDQILAVSGLLNPALLGPSVRPPYPSGSGSFRFGDRYQVSDLPGQRRRSLYTYIKRTSPFPNRITFDATDRTYCSSRRIRTNTPLQALALLNDPAYMDAAKALAREMIDQTNADEIAKIRWGYRKTMLKDPTPGKLATLHQLLLEALHSYENDEVAAYTLIANTLFNLDEFINK